MGRAKVWMEKECGGKMKRAGKFAVALVAGICLALFGRMVLEAILWTGFGAVAAVRSNFFSVTSEKADDGISEAIAQKFGEEDVWYRGKATGTDGTICYTYYLVSDKAGVLEQLVETANEVILRENLQDRVRLTCFQHYESGGASSRSDSVAVFSNFSLERGRYYQTFAKCALSEGFLGIYEKPETYMGLPEVRELEVNEWLARTAQAEGLDWHTCYPELEYFAIGPVIDWDGQVIGYVDTVAELDEIDQAGRTGRTEETGQVGKTGQAKEAGQAALPDDHEAKILLLLGDRRKVNGKDVYRFHWFANELGNRCYKPVLEDIPEFADLGAMYAYAEEYKARMEIEEVYPFMNETEVFDCMHYLELIKSNAVILEYSRPDGIVVEDSEDKSALFLCGVREGEDGSVEFLPLIEDGATEKRNSDEYAQKILRMLKYIE